MVQEELMLDGKTYTTSRKAAQLSEYTQDYIGQLCRAGQADSRRINGLWYVTLESLEAHKVYSAEVKAQAFANLDVPYEFDRVRNQETVLSFSGEEYVSARHGADLTGYNQDYITQLARGSKVKARQIGNRWYVSKRDLLANKKKNDALLAVVQADAAGLVRASDKKHFDTEKTENPIGSYKNEQHLNLMPLLPEKARVELNILPHQHDYRTGDAETHSVQLGKRGAPKEGGVVRTAGSRRVVALSILLAPLLFVGLLFLYWSFTDEKRSDKSVYGVYRATEILLYTTWDTIVSMAANGLADNLYFQRPK